MMGNVLSANMNLHVICMFVRTQMRSGRDDRLNFVVFIYFFLLYLGDNLKKYDRRLKCYIIKGIHCLRKIDALSSPLLILGMGSNAPMVGDW